MPRNGSGTYTRVAGSAYTNNTTADGPEVDAEMNDIATALTNSLARSGEGAMTGTLNMGGFGISNLGSMSVTGALNAKYVRGDSASASLPAISFQGDQTSGIYQTNGSYSISFSTNATHAMTINSAQKVGIGTNNPEDKLHVVDGPVRISGSDPEVTLFGTVSELGKVVGSVSDDSISFESYTMTQDVYLKSGATQMLKVVGLTTGAGLALGDPALGNTSALGHVYLPGPGGAPTIDPTTISGFSAIRIDSANNRIYCFTNGAWRYVQLTT